MSSDFILGKQLARDAVIKYVGSDTDVTVPGGVCFIGNNAFSGCKQIKTITLTDEITHIGHEAFKDCTSLEEIVMPETVRDLHINLFSGVGKSFRITFGGTSEAFEKMIKVVVSSQSFTNGDYHHPTGSHFSYSEIEINEYGNVFGDTGETPFECEVTCLADGKVLKYRSCSAETVYEREIKRY